ncbi:MAG: DNA-3-methyladenine glycosylase [Nitrosopumilus sp.]
MKILSREFYSQETTFVARKLLGKCLVRKINDIILSGTIIETEAYRSDDPASHTYIGITERNKVMFGEVGRAYVYTIHGIHNCIDVVARNSRFDAGGVLIRAIVPQKGIETMMRNRNFTHLKNLTNGPAKITQALQITKKHYGIDLTKDSERFIAEGNQHDQEIMARSRIGIKKGQDKMWNYRIDMTDREENHFC